ncbi:MAG: hypothetical protein KBT29_01560 [Prevotellaceae bacterium]|nr:hypothetical protein [Candidatus Minthosoma caballi]
MEKAKLIMMIVSLVFVALCFGASVYFSVALPAGDENLSTFYIMSTIFGAAVGWFGYNVYGLLKSK